MVAQEPGKLRVLIVGCGNIAGGFDAGRPAGTLPLTHVGAYSQNPAFDVLACIEPDPGRRASFMADWNIPLGFADFDELAQCPQQFDVISICSPTQAHAQDLEHAVAMKPMAIFCEKPVTLSAAQTEHWVTACAREDILLAVNHTRRWAPDVVQLQLDLARGAWGTVRSVVGHYNKGILNNGGHMLDLLIYLFGSLSVDWAGPAVFDFWPDDPSVAAVLRSHEGVPIHLCTACAQDYALFELEIVTSKGILKMENGGMNWSERRVVQDTNFKGYRRLGTTETADGQYQQAMRNAAANVCAALRQGAKLSSTGHTALQAQVLCEHIRNFAQPPTLRT